MEKSAGNCKVLKNPGVSRLILDKILPNNVKIYTVWKKINKLLIFLFLKKIYLVLKLCHFRVSGFPHENSQVT